jgi:hypothetical protein
VPEKSRIALQDLANNASDVETIVAYAESLRVCGTYKLFIWSLYVYMNELFATHLMTLKHYTIQPTDMAKLSVLELEFFLDFDDLRFIFGYSTDVFAQVCGAHPHLAPVFAEKLTALAATCNRDVRLFARPDGDALVNDFDFLTGLAAVAIRASKGTRAISAHKEGFVPPSLANVLGLGAESNASRTQTPTGAALPPVFLPALNIGQFMLPNIIARCGLFGADGPRGSVRQSFSSASPRVIQHLSGVRAGQTTITFTGEELWTSDEEVWTTLLENAVTTPLGEEVSVRIIDLLHAMPGRGVDGTSPRRRVRSAGARLKAATLKIVTSDPAAIATMKACLPNNPAVRDAEKKNFLELNVSLLEQFIASTDIITFRVSRELRALFGDKLHTWYNRDDYYSLPAEGLSRRLFLLYNSHFSCMPLTQAELTEYLGIKAKTVRNVRANLVAGHAELTKRGFDQGHIYRVPRAEERVSCTTACFVVKRPQRQSKVVAVAEPPAPALAPLVPAEPFRATKSALAALDFEDFDANDEPPVLDVIDYSSDYEDCYTY